MKLTELAIYGPMFITLAHRSSNPSQGTLKAYSYKHYAHYDSNGNFEPIFDLDQNSDLIQDLANPVAKINWQDGSVKVLNKHIWDNLPSTIQDYIAQDFRDFWLRYQV